MVNNRAGDGERKRGSIFSRFRTVAGTVPNREEEAALATTRIIREMQEHAQGMVKSAPEAGRPDASGNAEAAGTRRPRLPGPAVGLSLGAVGILLLASLVILQATGGSTAAGVGTLVGAPAEGGKSVTAVGGGGINSYSQNVGNIASDEGEGVGAGEGSVSAASIEAVKNAPARTGRFDLPLKKWFMVTDRYGAPRGRGTIHGGIDLALDDLPQSPVYAACEGRVTTSAYNTVLGNHVMVDCGEQWSTVYGHLSSIRVSEGQQVNFEDVLGISGSSGFSSGEHLHFEIRWQGWAVNPEKYLDFHIAPGAPLTYDIRDAHGDLIVGPIPTPTATPTATPTPDFSIIPAHLRPTVAPTKTPVPTATPIPPTPTITPTPTVTPRPGELGR